MSGIQISFSAAGGARRRTKQNEMKPKLVRWGGLGFASHDLDCSLTYNCERVVLGLVYLHVSDAIQTSWRGIDESFIVVVIDILRRF